MEGKRDLNLRNHASHLVADLGCLVVASAEVVGQLAVALDGVQSVCVAAPTFRPPTGSAVEEISRECGQRRDDRDQEGDVVLHADKDRRMVVGGQSRSLALSSPTGHGSRLAASGFAAEKALGSPYSR